MSSLTGVFNTTGLSEGHPKRVMANQAFKQEFTVKPFREKAFKLLGQQNLVNSAMEITEKLKGNGYNLFFAPEKGESLKGLAKRIEDIAEKFEADSGTEKVSYSKNRIVIDVEEGSDLGRLLGGEQPEEISPNDTLWADLRSDLAISQLEDNVRSMKLVS